MKTRVFGSCLEFFWQVKLRRAVVAAAAAAIVFGSAGPPALAQLGTDLFVTPAGSYDVVSLPADFFGPGSDPFEGPISFVGDPFTVGGGGQADTIVVRGTGGTPRIGALRLESTAPITVTFGGTGTAEYDVQACLSSVASQPDGWMGFYSWGFSSYLPVIAKLTFTKVSGFPGVSSATLDPAPQINLEASGCWSPTDGGLGVTTTTGGTVDHDCDPGTLAVSYPASTPGIFVGVCDEAYVELIDEAALLAAHEANPPPPVPGPVLEACCFGAHCADLKPTDCDALGGVGLGLGTDCDPNPCGVSPPTGACCDLDTLACDDGMLESVCDLLYPERTWLGAGTTCALGCKHMEVIPIGNDYFETTAGSSRVAIGGTSSIPPIPADFFFPGSLPWEGTIELRNEHIAGYCGSVNTVIGRKEEAVMPGPAIIAVELKELSLVSVTPIAVTGGKAESFFDVFVTLNPLQPSLGEMMIQGGGGGGGYSFRGREDGGIALYPRLVFTPVESGDPPIAWDPPNSLYLESATQYPWQSEEPAYTCETGSMFYPVPEVEVLTLLDQGQSGEHGVIPPRLPDACCLPNGDCIMIFPADCIFWGGHVMPGMQCYGSMDACCLPDGSCTMADPLCCMFDLGGVPVYGATCAFWTEACCDSFLPYGCMNADPVCCTSALGGWLPGQAMCLGDNNGNGTDDACEQQGECVPTPDGLNCEPVLCPISTEVCLPKVIRHGVPTFFPPDPGTDVLPATTGYIALQEPGGGLRTIYIVDGPPGETMVIRESPVDVGGHRELLSEITAMHLIGIGGGMMLDIRESPTRASSGLTVGAVGTSDYPADSFFDLFVEIDIPDLGVYGLYNGEKIPISAPGITAVPPLGSAYRTPTGWQGVELLDAYGEPTGYIITEVNHEIPPAQDPGPEWEVIDCDCLDPSYCHVALDLEPFCIGECPTPDVCVMTVTVDPFGNELYECRCESQPTECVPTPDGLNCEPVLCPIPTEVCLPKVIRHGVPTFFPSAGEDVLTGTTGYLVVLDPGGIPFSYPIRESPNLTRVIRESPTDVGGHREVASEIIEMELMADGGGGGAMLIRESPTRASSGLTVGAAMGTSDYPADSFFDLFVEIDIPDLGVYGLYNDQPIPLSALGITAVPPLNSDYRTPTGWEGVELLDAYGEPTGYIIIEVDHELPPAQHPGPEWEVIDCDCVDPNYCHVALDLEPFCTGECPAPELCQMTVTVDPFGNELYECRCQVPAEACCWPGGSCTMEDPTYCATMDGWPQGAGSVCSGVLEACCVPNMTDPGMTCLMVDPLCCDELGGNLQGAGSMCAGLTIPCCINTGTITGCVDVDPTCCDDLGGYQGFADFCLGDLDGNGIDDACEEVVLEPKWVQPPHSGSQGFDAASDLWWSEGGGVSKWTQWPDVSFTGLHCHDGPFVGSRIICANDWLCEGGPVTDLHWWGYYEPQGMGEQQWGFLLSIHGHDPANCLPSDQGPLPLPLYYTVPLSQITMIDTGMISVTGEPVYNYQWNLPEPFAQIAGEQYWVDISSISVDPNNPMIWKWVQSTPPVLCTAATKQQPTPGVWQSVVIEPGEFAFEVTSVGGGPQPVEPNKVLADDFISDGRPIEGLRWWGSCVDPMFEHEYAVEPYMIDGWFITYYYGDPAIMNPGCPPMLAFDGHPTALGVYYAPIDAVTILPLFLQDCLGHRVYEYVVNLNRCCLLCAHPDPRVPDGVPPAEPGAFHERAGLHYWMGIQAVVGVTWNPPACSYDSRILTGHLPSPTPGGHFWGWHTSPPQALPHRPLWGACTGRIADFTPYPPECWDYDGWNVPLWECPTPAPDQIEMAFELLARESLIDSFWSTLTHGLVGPLRLELANVAVGAGTNIEPRLPGVRQLDFEMAEAMNPATVIAANVQVSCYNTPYGGAITASLQGGLGGPNTKVVVGFAPALPDQDCCVVSLNGMSTASGRPVVGGKFARTLRGDIDRGGLVTPGDASIIKPKFGQTPTAATAPHDFDASGLVTPGDFSQVKPKFGNAAPDCP